jgi:hypothetical protein
MGESNPEQRVHAVMDKVLERIATDPAFGQKLIADSQVALSAVGMEKEVEELRALTAKEAEVGGFGVAPGTQNACGGTPNSRIWCHVPTCKVSVISVGYGLA